MTRSRHQLQELRKTAQEHPGNQAAYLIIELIDDLLWYIDRYPLPTEAHDDDDGTE